MLLAISVHAFLYVRDVETVKRESEGERGERGLHVEKDRAGGGRVGQLHSSADLSLQR